MRLTVLSVGFPLAPVTPDPVGGAEQVLSRLDRALVERGHRSIVIAPEGSRTAGDLLTVPAVRQPIGEAEAEEVRAAVRARIAEAVAKGGVDVVHFHGLDFGRYLPPDGPPVLVTLHLPLDWYAEGALTPDRTDVALHPVSASQARSAPAGARLGAPIENGVDLPEAASRKRRYAFALGRICPEKGFDDALDAAQIARVPLILAGHVFPYPSHEAHFRERIAPRLDWRRRWIGAVQGERKRSLLGAARCVVIASKARETSSLVAMEAIAAGTPVVAYPSGALAEIVEPGVTGYLAETPAGLAEAIGQVDALCPELCRARARERFPAERMIDAYLSRYAELAS